MDHSRLRTPDHQLLSRFGVVRAVGGGGYLVAAVVLAGIYGWRAWPLLLGVPVLAIVTALYFRFAHLYPRSAVIASLVTDALVLGGAAAFVGGSGSGTGAVYAVVIVSGGLLLGPPAAAGFTLLGLLLAWLQLAAEELGVTPLFLHRAPMDERVQVLAIVSAVLASIGYLTATYASRLQEEIVEAGDAAEVVKQRGRRRRSLVRQASIDVAAPLRAVEAVADRLDTGEPPDAEELRRLAGALRMGVTQLDAEVTQLADLGAMDESGEERPEPVLLSRVVGDCLLALEARLAGHEVSASAERVMVVGDRRAARRVVYNLLENVADHTPAGTHVIVRALRTADRGVVVVSDDGPGLPSHLAHRAFDPPDEGGGPRVGLPLVAELAAAMGATVRYEPVMGGGARFLVGFRLAPGSIPTEDDNLAVVVTEPDHQQHQPQR